MTRDDNIAAFGDSTDRMALLASDRVSVHDALEGWQRGYVDDDRAVLLTGAADVAGLYVLAYGHNIEIRFARPVVVCIPGVMSGDPVIAGTRVLAESVLAEIKSGYDEASIREVYPTLPGGVVEAVIDWQKNS